MFKACLTECQCSIDISALRKFVGGGVRLVSELSCLASYETDAGGCAGKPEGEQRSHQ